MKRLLVFALLVSMGNTSLVFAEESLLKSGVRHVQQLSRSETTSTTATRTPLFGAPLVAMGKAPVAPALLQDGPKTLQTSGMGKGLKWMIAAGAAAALLGTWYAIDHGVEDVTPSTLGTRRDTCPGAPHCS